MGIVLAVITTQLTELETRKDATMVTRIRAQAMQLTMKAKAAAARGDQKTWERCQKEWVRLMRLALNNSAMVR